MKNLFYNCIIIFLLTPYVFFSQWLSKSESNHSLNFSLALSQVKDDFNYGLVYSGINLSAEYQYSSVTKKEYFEYLSRIYFGANYNKGIGITFGAIPGHLFYGVNVKQDNINSIFVGGFLNANYNWQLYPELQSGHMFWVSSLELGPEIKYILRTGENNVKICLRNSLAGFVSRPSPNTETHFYTLNFYDFVVNANKNLKFGSLNLFNHTMLEVEYNNLSWTSISLNYKFDYFIYNISPGIKFLNHSLAVKWRLN